MRWPSLRGRPASASTGPSSDALAPWDAAPFGPHFVQRLEALTLVSRRILRERLRRKHWVMQRGSGVEFIDHREYQLGDDPRLIDWNASQRRDQLLVRVNEEPQDHTSYVLLDTSHSMRFPTLEKFRVAQQVTAALGYVSARDGDRVMVGCFAEGQLVGAEPSRGVSYLATHLRLLEAQLPKGLTQYSTMSRQFVARYKRRGTVYVISDLAAPEEALRATDELQFRGHQVHWVHLTVPGFFTAIAPGDYTLEDSETGEILEVTLSQERQARLEGAENASDRECLKLITRRGGKYSRARVDQGFESIVLGALRDRQPSEMKGGPT